MKFLKRSCLSRSRSRIKRERGSLSFADAQAAAAPRRIAWSKRIEVGESEEFNTGIHSSAQLSRIGH